MFGEKRIWGDVKDVKRSLGGGRLGALLERTHHIFHRTNAEQLPPGVAHPHFPVKRIEFVQLRHHWLFLVANHRENLMHKDASRCERVKEERVWGYFCARLSEEHGAPVIFRDPASPQQPYPDSRPTLKELGAKGLGRS